MLFKNHAENKTGRLVPDSFLFFKKHYIRKNQVVCSLVSIPSIVLNLARNKNKLIKP